MQPQEIWRLFAAFIGIITLVLLISRVKLHPLISILSVSVALAAGCGLPLLQIVKSFEAGMGGALGHAALVIALGSMLGKMLSESGGAEEIANTILHLFGRSRIPWAMLVIGLLVGLPVFFEVGFVLLMPLAFHVARRTDKNIVLVALPMLAGLSIVHALIPPHPAAIVAVNAFHASVGRSLLLSLLIGVPSAILAGPVYATWISRKLGLPVDHMEKNPIAAQYLEERYRTSAPGFVLTLGTVLLPVILMLVGGLADRVARLGGFGNQVLQFIGSGDIALLLGVLASFVTFGLMQGIKREEISRLAASSLLPSVGAMLLIGAGGGFGHVLQDSGISAAIMHLAGLAHLSLPLTAWLFAALLRLATGSSTVAMTTAASVVSPIALATPGAHLELLAIATGAGSIIFSHVNDGGFWLTREYLHLNVAQTFATWSVCETILSISGLILVLVCYAI